MRRIFREAAIDIALLVVSTSLTLVALEFALRTWNAWRYRASRPDGEGWNWIQADAGLVYRLHPASKHFSARGSQNELRGAPPAGFRILLLGDSVAFNGDGFGDTIAGRLEARLNADPALETSELLNPAVPGYTNYQELLWLKKYGLEFRPRLVGAVFVLNDMHRFLHAIRTRPGDSYRFGDLVFDQEAIDTLPSFWHWLQRRSQLAEAVYLRIPIAHKALEFYERGGYGFDYRVDFSTAWQDRHWPMIEDNLAEMVRLGKARGFGVFLVAMPFGEQYRKDYLERDRAYVLKPQRKLREICGRLGIPLLDLYSALDPAHDIAEDRIHLTGPGRKKAGERIAEFLVAEGLAPRSAPAR